MMLRPPAPPRPAHTPFPEPVEGLRGGFGWGGRADPRSTAVAGSEATAAAAARTGKRDEEMHHEPNPGSDQIRRLIRVRVPVTRN